MVPHGEIHRQQRGGSFDEWGVCHVAMGQLGPLQGPYSMLGQFQRIWLYVLVRFVKIMVEE